MNPVSKNEIEGYRLSIFITIILAFVILSYLHSILRMFIIEKNFGDFANYYFFAKLMNEGTNIFKLTRPELLQLKQTSLIPVYIASDATNYSPFFHIIITPFTYLSFWPAALMWTLLNNVSLVISLLITASICQQERQDRIIYFGILGITLFAPQPLLENMGLGQINALILLALVTVCYFQHIGKRDLFSGALLGFVLMLKPQYGGLLLLFFFLKRNYSLCVYAAASYIVFHVTGALVYGWQIEASYWHRLVYVSSYVSTNPSMHNLSLLGVFNRVFIGSLTPMYHKLFQLVTAIGFSIYTFLRIFRRKETDFLVEYSSIICLSLLVSPLMEEHHLVMMFLPFVVAIYNLKIDKTASCLLVTSFLLVSVRYSLNAFSQFHSGIPAILTAGKISGVLLLWYLFVRDIEPGGAKTLARPDAVS